MTITERVNRLLGKPVTEGPYNRMVGPMGSQNVPAELAPRRAGDFGNITSYEKMGKTMSAEGMTRQEVIRHCQSQGINGRALKYVLAGYDRQEAIGEGQQNEADYNAQLSSHYKNGQELGRRGFTYNEVRAWCDSKNITGSSRGYLIKGWKSAV